MTSCAARRQKELDDEDSLLLKQTKELEGQVALAQQQLSFATKREETTSASLSLVRGQHQVHDALQQENDMEAQAGREKRGSAVERSARASSSVSVSAQQVCARLSGADAQGQERSKRERRKTDFFNPEMTCSMQDAPPLPPSSSSAPAPAAEAHEGEALNGGEKEKDIDGWRACGKRSASHKALAYCVAAGHSQQPRFKEEDGEGKGKGGSGDADGVGGEGSRRVSQGSSRMPSLVGRQVHKFFVGHGWFEVCV